MELLEALRRVTESIKEYVDSKIPSTQDRTLEIRFMLIHDDHNPDNLLAQIDDRMADGYTLYNALNEGKEIVAIFNEKYGFEDVGYVNRFTSFTQLDDGKEFMFVRNGIFEVSGSTFYNEAFKISAYGNLNHYYF